MNASISSTQTENGQKCLTFELGGETYGVEILKVQEIIGMMKVTRVPRMPNFVRGVVNLRGRVIPVVDLRLRFGIEETPDTERTCIVIAQVVSAKSGDITMGVVVEEVSEVVDIPDGQIEAAPEFGAGINTDFLLGMGKMETGVVMLLDIDTVLSQEDLGVLNDVS